MKIGVALSGCDIGGVSAWAVLSELESQGFDIGMISASCVPATTALLYANGYTETVMKKLSELFLKDARESDIDFAIANLSAKFRKSNEAKKSTPLCINAVDVSDGEIVAFSEDHSLCGENLRIFPAAEPYDMLSATVSLVDGLGSYLYEGRRLCDFCCWYGCPVHQLRLAGMEKIISVAFVPEKPKTPYEALSKRMISGVKCSADIHIVIEFEDKELSFDEYAKIAAQSIKNHMNEIALKTLF